MSIEQKNNGVPVIDMDTRKFLRLINSSAQSRIKSFEEALQRMGEKAEKKYRLSALSESKLVFEDVDTADYYLADIKKQSGGRYRLDNVQRIQLTESEKPKIFGENCSELVNALAQNDRKSAEKVWEKIEKQRFRSTVVPDNGWVTARDGIARKVKIANKELTSEERITRVAKAVVEGLKENIELNENGQLVCGVFSEGISEFVVPIDEYGCRKAYARKMKKIATEAYCQKGFQRLVRNVAALVSHGKLEEATKKAAAFLTEEQEFCLLDPHEMKYLVENTLATQAVFNSFLAKDTAKLLYRTNMTFNRDTILEAWRSAAVDSHRSDLMEIVENLAESKQFAAQYAKSLLKHVFTEDGPASNQQMLDRTKLMLRAIKDLLRNDPNSTDELETVRDLESRIDAKSSMDHRDRDEVDSLAAAIYQHHKDKIDNLEYFTTYPEDEAEEGEGEHEGEPVPMPDELQSAGGDLGGIGEFDLGGGMDLAPEGATPNLGMGGAEAGMGGDLAGAGAPAMAGAGAGASLGLEGKDFVMIDKMDVQHLTEELDHWETDGTLYLQEDGFDDCFEQMQSYIRRCIAIGPNADHLREKFEQMRETIVESGSDVLNELPKDAYRSTVDGLFDDDFALNSSYMSEDNLRMNDQQGGGGIVKGKAQKSDGTKGTKTAGAGSAASGDPKMDTALQGSDSVQDEAPKKTDGRKGQKAAGAGGAAKGPAAMDSSKQGSGGIVKGKVKTEAKKTKKDITDCDECDEMLTDDQYVQTGRVKTQRTQNADKIGKKKKLKEDVAIVMSKDQHIDDALIKAVVAAMQTGDTSALDAISDDEPETDMEVVTMDTDSAPDIDTDETEMPDFGGSDESESDDSEVVAEPDVEIDIPDESDSEDESDDESDESDSDESSSEEDSKDDDKDEKEDKKPVEEGTLSDRIDQRLDGITEEEDYLSKGASNKAAKGGAKMDEFQKGTKAAGTKKSGGLKKPKGGVKMDEFQRGKGVADKKGGLSKPKGGNKMSEFQKGKGVADKGGSIGKAKGGAKMDEFQKDGARLDKKGQGDHGSSEMKSV